MKRFLKIMGILAVVFGGAAGGYYYYTAVTAPEPLSLTDDPNVEIVKAERQTIVDTVSATGQLEPTSEVEMKFEVGGTVKEVLVKRGQFVKAGTVLARLDIEDLELAVQKAEIDLAQQEAALEQLLEPAAAEDIAAARANLTSSQLKLDDLLDGPDPDDVTKAESALAQKQVELKKAQWAYDQVAYKGDVGAMPQADELQQKTLEYESAVADYNQAVKEASEADIAESRATLVSRQAELAKLLKGPSAAEIASKQADIDRARLTLQEARNNLKQVELVAPTTGVILSIEIEPGERVLNEADQAALVIADVSAFLLKVNVDEIDIAQLAQGQRATVTLDAFIDETFEGAVIDIAPQPIDSGTGGGIVNYEVTVSLDAGANSKLLPGMTATAAIETKRLQEVVVVPNRAIRIDRESEPSMIYVEKLAEDGDLLRVEVELGLRDSQVTEVVAGVEAGDQIVIRTEPEIGSPPGI